MFKMIFKNFITLDLKTLILQLIMKCLPTLFITKIYETETL